ncbi:hypothetical protein SD70_07550 [Gordoniibacillus kamchatkensis]|uniref:Uncharacterized protein n=1 Tax=Gordoniibacillus kamchatkensis TaxID=1590651 RepID=A0ABR5AJW3_9BACL|nr:hypothetical protein [Paenibacillus sp. VKM B-2647]KIL41304.1 hypothetical protein SD70_07550 [Paenibacillus sp. VKM B-2647]
MLQYAAAANRWDIYRQQTLFLRRYLLQPSGHVRWKTDSSHRQKLGSNAAIDDLRIVRALLAGARKWGAASDHRLAKEIADALLRDNRTGNLLADHYNTEDGAKAETLTSSYLDPASMFVLAKEDSRWLPVAEASLKLLTEAAQPNGFYRKTYNLARGEWTDPAGSDRNMIDTLLAAIHAQEAGAPPVPTLRLVQALWSRDGRLYGTYRDDLQAASADESPAVYALAVRLLEQAGEAERAKPLRSRLAQLAVQDPASPFYGGFLDPATLECYSFDNLQALIVENGKRKQQ